MVKGPKGHPRWDPQFIETAKWLKGSSQGFATESPSISLYMVGSREERQHSSRAAKDHINTRILSSMISGIPLIFGPEPRM